MAEGDRPRGGFLRRAADRARAAADVLREEYRKGQAGDDSPVQRIGPTATDRLKAWLERPEPEPEPAPEPEPEATGEPVGERAPEPDEVAGLLRGVDWRAVSSSITESRAVQRMKDLAGQVDWAAAKPAAARVATALIAAAASGELGALEGRRTAVVARTIINETGLGDRVADLLSRDHTPQAAPLRAYIDTNVIETTATEATTPAGDAFTRHLDDLGRALPPASS